MTHDRLSFCVLRPVAWSCVILLAVLSLLSAEEMVRTSLGGHIEHATAYAGTTFLPGLSYPAWDRKRIAAALVVYAGIHHRASNLEQQLRSAGRPPHLLLGVHTTVQQPLRRLAVA